MKHVQNALVPLACIMFFTACSGPTDGYVSGLPSPGWSELWGSDGVHRYKNHALGIEVSFLGPDVLGKKAYDPEDGSNNNIIALVMPNGTWVFANEPSSSIWQLEFYPDRKHWESIAERLHIADELDERDWRVMSVRDSFPALIDFDGDGMWDEMTRSVFEGNRPIEFKAVKKD